MWWQWCPQNGLGLFCRTLESWSDVIKYLVTKSVPVMSACLYMG